MVNIPNNYMLSAKPSLFPDLTVVRKCELHEIWQDGALALKLLKSDSHLTKNCVIYFIESPLKMMNNAFYFILKALFVLKIFKFFS